MGAGSTTRSVFGRKSVFIGAFAIVTALALGVSAFAPGTGGASSHREAPFIATDPTADGTDLYAFRAPDNDRKVALIANYIPLQEPAGGPNFHMFGDDVRYQIKVDNDGDAKPDVRYIFRFDTSRETGETFLYNTNQVTTPDDPDLNVKQTYTVTRVRNGNKTVIGTDLLTAPTNVGPRSNPDYEAVSDAAIYDIDQGGTVVAGSFDDPFFVDLGSIFDLGGLRPFNGAHLIPLPPEDGVDGVAGYNVSSIVLRVPIRRLTADGEFPSGEDDPNAVIGVWTTSERRQTRVLKPNGKAEASGEWVQISRLGFPLVNEVVIPLKDKNRWNGSQPSEDGQFLEYVTDPELARLIEILYPGVDTPPPPRDDLVTVALTGIPGVNQPAGVTASEQLRLNMMTPSTPLASQNRLGFIGGDPDGFPNGRRLGDDVTDVLIRAFAGGYPLTPAFDHPPNNLLGDGVDENDAAFSDAFPYLALPHQGYSHTHHGQVMGP